MNLELKSVHEAQSLYEAIEDRLEKMVSEHERERLQLLRARIEEVIRQANVEYTRIRHR